MRWDLTSCDPHAAVIAATVTAFVFLRFLIDTLVSDASGLHRFEARAQWLERFQNLVADEDVYRFCQRSGLF